MTSMTKWLICNGCGKRCGYLKLVGLKALCEKCRAEEATAKR